MGLKILHRKDGTPYARPSLGTDPATGKPLRPYKEFPNMTDEEAAEAAARWLEEVTSARAAGKITVNELLTRYLATLRVSGRAPSTVDTYEGAARRYSGTIGRARADALTTDAINSHIIAMIDGRGREPLSPSTVNVWRSMMMGAYKWGTSCGIVTTNPVPASIRPRSSPTEARPLDPEAAQMLLCSMESAYATERKREGKRHRFAAAAALATMTALESGMRLGEVLALRPCDISAPTATPTIWVRGTVTDAKGRPTRRPMTKGHKPRAVSVSKGTINRLESFMPPRWKRDTEAPIFTTDGKRWMSRRAVGRWFGRKAKEIGLPEWVTFHTLRHTHATLLLGKGIDAKTVQERLGHADVATTLRIYAHVMPARDAQAAAAIEEAIIPDVSGTLPTA